MQQRHFQCCVILRFNKPKLCFQGLKFRLSRLDLKCMIVCKPLKNAADLCRDRNTTRIHECKERKHDSSQDVVIMWLHCRDFFFFSTTSRLWNASAEVITNSNFSVSLSLQITLHCKWKITLHCPKLQNVNVLQTPQKHFISRFRLEQMLFERSEDKGRVTTFWIGNFGQKCPKNVWLPGFGAFPLTTHLRLCWVSSNCWKL